MIAAYKYCDPDRHAAMLRGSIRLRRLSFYRRSEAGGVQDPLDGRSEVRMTRTFGPGDRIGVQGWPNNISLISVEGDDSSVTWKGGTMAAELNPLVFCSASSRDDHYWQNEHDAHYGGLIGIFDFQKLASRISNALYEIGMRNTFDLCAINYRAPAPMTGDNIPAPDPCVKSESFHKEKEIRAIFLCEKEKPKEMSQTTDVQIEAAEFLMNLRTPE